jgi:hypothetical protein
LKIDIWYFSVQLVQVPLRRQKGFRSYSETKLKMNYLKQQPTGTLNTRSINSSKSNGTSHLHKQLAKLCRSFASFWLTKSMKRNTSKYLKPAFQPSSRIWILWICSCLFWFIMHSGSIRLMSSLFLKFQGLLMIFLTRAKRSA